ncbi:MAG: helix-turn-helix domain-containing protein [Nitrososphaeraceae archaeon]
MNPNNQTYDINHRDKLYYTMGGNIPVKTKHKVLKLWLSGVSRKKIAEKVGIGEGTVTSIVQEAKENIPDVDLLHEVATKITRNNWDINIFSSGISHRKILYKKGITDDQIDSLIENVDEHCFKKQIRVEHFVKLVQEVAETLLKYDCSIDVLPELIAEKQTELFELEQTIESLKSSKVELLYENELTEKEINDYSRDKPLVETIEGLREEIRDLKAVALMDKNRILALEAKWVVVPFLPENMTVEEVEEAARLLLRNGVDLIKVIKYIQKKAPHLPYTTTGPRFIDQEP